MKITKRQRIGYVERQMQYLIDRERVKRRPRRGLLSVLVDSRDQLGKLLAGKIR